MDADLNWTKDRIRVALLVRKDQHVMTSWEVIILSRTRNISSSKTKKDSSFIDLMSSVIRYAEAFSEEYKTSFQDARVKDIAQDMERTNFLDMKSTSTYERYARVAKMLCRFKTVLNRIRTIDQFAAGQESGKSGVTYLNSRILTHGTEETILLLLDGVEAYFGSPNKGMFDANMYYRIGNEFLEHLNTLLDQVNISCELELDETPKTMKEMMAISIPETKSRMQTIHNINHSSIHSVVESHPVKKALSYFFDSISFTIIMFCKATGFILYCSKAIICFYWPRIVLF